MDAYTHLDMSSPDPVSDLEERMRSASIKRALLVETWRGDNHSCLQHLIASPRPQFRIALCFRPDQTHRLLKLLNQSSTLGLRVKTSDLEHLGDFVPELESSGKWLLAHAESGIAALTEKLMPLACRHPHLCVYVPHLAWPKQNGLADAGWGQTVEKLSSLPSIIAGISAIAHFSNEPFPHLDVAGCALHSIGMFGADSIVVGSDYPLLEKSRYADYLALAVKWIRQVYPQWASKWKRVWFSTSSERSLA